MKALNEPPPYKSYPPLTPKLARGVRTVRACTVHFWFTSVVTLAVHDIHI